MKTLIHITRAILGKNAIFFLISVFVSTITPAQPTSHGAQPLQSSSFEKFRDCNVCSEMMAVPGGAYMMGATKEELGDSTNDKIKYLDETPRHPERVRSFALAKFKVTKREFSVFTKETGFVGKGCRIYDGKAWRYDPDADWMHPGFEQTEQDPVVCVSWDDAQKFIRWLNAKIPESSHHKYRLPTEVEWEYAARAGTATPTYWGDEPAETCRHENTRDLSKNALDQPAQAGGCSDRYAFTSPVGSFSTNPWGFSDMLGDALEWIQDCPKIGYRIGPSYAPDSSTTCRTRGLRGASWASIPIAVRAANRTARGPTERNSTVGFRMASDLSR
ncbi:formylglycine-generating enzyme family protein [Paraburkholderia agricolaris]|jgi:formylglycine-generating enzyme required for sulfatase activity